MKILIQRADRLGDTVLALPVVEQLKKYNPTATIHMMVSPISVDMLELHPHVERLIVVEWGSKGEVANKRYVLRQMLREKYDVYISLWNHQYMAYLGWRAKIPVRIGDTTNL